MASNSQFITRLLKEDREQTLVGFQRLQDTLAQARHDSQLGDKTAAQFAEFSLPTSLPSDAPPSMSLETYALQKWRTHRNKVESGLCALSQPSARPASMATSLRTTVSKQPSHLKVVGVLDSIPIPLIPMAHMVPTVTASPIALRAAANKRPSPSPDTDSDSEPIVTKAHRSSKTSATASGTIRRRESTKTAPAVQQPTASSSNMYSSIKPVRKSKVVEATPAVSTARRGSADASKSSNVARKFSEHDLGQAVYLIRQFRIRLDKILKNPNRLDEFIDELRKDLHKLVFAPVVKMDVQNERLLDHQTGLPTIFDNQGIAWPWDVIADAEELFNNWKADKFAADLLEGIDAPIKRAKAGNLATKTSSRAPEWTIKPGFKVPHSESGHNGLVAGQWWPRQICAFRDGAHGTLQGGISGSKTDGARSVVMSGKEYEKEDEDHGDYVWYSGTMVSKDKVVDGERAETTYTKIMLKSVGSGKPVRLMRSSNLGKSNAWKPSEGFRYDGLYLVTKKRCIDEDKGHWQFLLERMPGQPPIRRSGTLEGRPNEEEVIEWARIRNLLGIGLSE